MTPRSAASRRNSAPSGGRIRIDSAGALCTVQDRGRGGYQRFGVSVSGALDWQALALGNRLLGNDPDAAALEITYGGFQATFETNMTIALTGADLDARLDGAMLQMWEVCHVHAGQVLEMPGARWGIRTYLCVAGGIGAPRTLGSRSTYLPAHLGGLSGRPLSSGDVLPILRPRANPSSGARVPRGIRPWYGSKTVRVIPGPQDDYFTRAGLDMFFASTYVVTNQSNRQGLRLDGPTIESRSGDYNIISDGVATGAVQVPGDGKPIVLMADRQTTGGYPKIGVVATIDLPILAQQVPGAPLQFVRTTPQLGHRALRQWYRQLDALEKRAVRPKGHRMELVVNGIRYEAEVEELS